MADLPLTCLAPGIVQAILDGQQAKGLRLAEMLGNGRGQQRAADGLSMGDMYQPGAADQPDTDE